MSTVELFGFAPSTYVRTARLVCEEKNIDYTLQPLEFQAASHRAVHPYLRMPAMRHGNVELFETLAIAVYLNEEFSGRDLEASTAIERATMFQWVSAANDYLYGGIVGHLSAAGDGETPDMTEAGKLLLPVNDALSRQPYLAGGELTLADLFLLPMLLYAETTLGNRDWLESCPDVVQWLDKLRERQSVTRTGG